MKNQLLFILEPQQVLVWTCVVVFIATSAITLLGIIRKLDIDPSFLNKLFVALILEIVAIGVLAFKDSFKPAPVTEFVKIVTPKTGFSVGQNPTVFVDGAYNKTSGEEIKGYIRANNKVIPLANNSKENGIFSTTIDSSLLANMNNLIIALAILKADKTVAADSISLKK